MTNWQQQLQEDDAYDAWAHQVDLENRRWIEEYDRNYTGDSKMTFIAKDTGGGDFPEVPEGTHLAICYLLVDLGYQDTNFGIKHKIMIGWELPEEKMQDGRPFVVSKDYTMSLSEKANLRSDLESWRGKAFTEAELEGFDLSNIMGVPCMVTVVHNQTKAGNTWANVKAVTSVPKGIKIPERHNELLPYDIDDHNQAAWDRLPEWIQKKIEKAVKAPDVKTEHAKEPDTEGPKF